MMVFDNKRTFEAFPIIFQDINGVQNDNVFYLSRLLDYIFWLGQLENQERTPLNDAIKRLYYNRLFDAFDDGDATQKAIHLSVMNSIAYDYNVKAYEFASEEYGYSSDQVLEIKSNLIDEFWDLNSYIGTIYAIRRALQLFLFTNIVVDDTIAPTLRRDGTWFRDGTIRRDGTVVNAWAFHSITAVKPSGLSINQAEFIARKVIEGYQPAYTKIFDLTIT